MPKQKKLPKKSWFSRYIASVWLFPSILFILVCFLSVFKISGTSIGIYHQVAYGQTSHDPDLLWGEPRGIRSDEWLYMTQMTIAQQQADYPRINQNIGSGRDMSLNLDVPYKEWSVIFKPQNLVFFVLPLEYAFAFKWWLLLMLLIVSCYFFILRLFPGKRLLAALLATAVGLSPFVFWWYQLATIGPLFYAFFIMLLGMRIINSEPFPLLKNRNMKYSYGLYGVGLTYLLTCFALIIYPPFQIPVAIVVAAFLLGYLLDHRLSLKTINNKQMLKRMGIFLVAGMVAGIICLVFLKTRSDAVSRITGTVYPGARVVKSGGTSPQYLFSSFLQPQLQRDERAAQYFTNQSEASNFLLFVPFLILPSFGLLLYERRRTGNIDWVFLTINAVLVLFLVRMYVPFGTRLYKLVLLESVPHERLLIGLGLAGVLQLVYFIKRVDSLKNSGNLQRFAVLYSLICFVILAISGVWTRSHYPKFITNPLYIAVLALLFSSMIFLFVSGRKLIGAIILCAFSFLSVFKIHPLYRGLGFVLHDTLPAKVQAISKPTDKWAVADNIYFENMPLASNRDEITGIQVYPDLNLWSQVDGTKEAFIYNRYAHVLLNTDPAFVDPIRLIQFDSFQVKFSCNDFILHNVNYLLDIQKVDASCAQLVYTVQYPGIVFYIYKVSP